jgi:hypothetical protein
LVHRRDDAAARRSPERPDGVRVLDGRVATRVLSS